MAKKRVVEVFSAGCNVCQEIVELVNKIACPSCDVKIQDMKDPSVSARAKDLGIGSVPAIVIDGQLASCCKEKGLTEEALRSAGIGQPLD